MATKEEVRDVIIIGSGPAGLTAAIYAARANLKPLVIEGGGSAPGGNLPGGQLMLTTEVENYPGFVQGIMGPDMMKIFRDQAARFGTEYTTAEVTKVDFSIRPFKIWIGDDVHLARSVIISTGAKSLMLNLPREDRLLGHGLSTCATCDGFFFTGQEVAVVGGGDSAMEEALFLTKFARQVTMIHRRDAFRASKIMQQRVLRHPKIRVLWNSQVTELVGESQLEAVKLHNKESNRDSVMKVGGLFYAIGHVPNTSLFKGQLEMDPAGYLVTGQGARTNVEGVFAAGDVQDHVYRQAVTAAGSGCMAAIDAERWLESQPTESVIAGTPTNW
ncbi:thioredoxin-disulfide reductase [Candidatus Parcubacteria bacterium]|nr:thioredoxin-disulfide reductase [Candidatus Parcubacteria bacterium]